VVTLVLEERGVLSLDDPVHTYLPNLEIARAETGSKPVTIRHLLSHTSGIPSYGSPMEHVTLERGTVSYPRQRHPAGTCYNYSNPGYVILKHVLEAAAGKSYDTVLRDTVLEPLGMHSSHGQESNGTGGIVSTLEDLAKYTSMLINEGTYKGKRIISRESFRTMLAPVLERPDARVDYHYSLSWEVITVSGKVDSFYKAGRWGGQASAIQVFPEKGIALVYLANPPHHRSAPFMDWRRQLTGRLRGLLRHITDDPNLCRSWPHIPSRDLNQYEGIYVHPETGHRVRVFMKGGKLYSDYLGMTHPLQSFSSLRFLSPHRGALHSFVWKDEHVVGLALRNGYYRLQNE
jgi:CubicO group peptidase (beta-lactamase class C family)